jgi:COMPASS component SDC1
MQSGIEEAVHAGVEESPASPSATAATPETLPLAQQQPATRSQSQSRAHSPASRSSLLPGAAAMALLTPPTLANQNGSPARVYLNANVTPHLLEGMKHLAAHEPERPLRWLAEFLRKKSEELEA